jgi:hypothetical protein
MVLSVFTIVRTVHLHQSSKITSHQRSHKTLEIKLLVYARIRIQIRTIN